MKYKSYHWFHIPTGKQGVNDFSQTQYDMVGWPMRFGMPELAAHQLVNDWNRQPNWKYWLA